MSFNVSLSTESPESLYNATVKPRPPIGKVTVISVSFLTLFICLLGLVGNGVIIWLLSFRIKRNQFTVYILNLAVADFLFLLGCGIYTMYIICILVVKNIPATADIYIGILSEMLAKTGFNASCYLLAGISAERCLSVLFPFYNSILRPKHQAAIVAACLWGLATLTMALEVFVCKDDGNYLSKGAERCIPVIIFTSTVFVLVLLLMVFSSMILLIKIQKTSKFCRPPRFYIVILFTLLVFFVSIIPARVLSLLIFFDVVRSKTLPLIFYFIISICTAIHCTANPYIYITVGRWSKRIPLKMAVEKMFQ
ncbi:mas-related G-protein coupled receptor member H-like [Ascaphus truei]|uniref:mas-related G-protein coupled receptor member H-like n=1 Tax=Ascaphus truei TaxID=8439 RepID=UPI003F5A299F